MIDHWTVLWITILSGPLADARMGIIYPTEAACDAADAIRAMKGPTL